MAQCKSLREINHHRAANNRPQKHSAMKTKTIDHQSMSAEDLLRHVAYGGFQNSIKRKIAFLVLKEFTQELLTVLPREVVDCLKSPQSVTRTWYWNSTAFALAGYQKQMDAMEAEFDGCKRPKGYDELEKKLWLCKAVAAQSAYIEADCLIDLWWMLESASNHENRIKKVILGFLSKYN
jgi:hypothetical protein